MEEELKPGEVYHDPVERRTFEIVSVYRDREVDNVTIRDFYISYIEPFTIARKYFLRLFKKGYVPFEC